ncbi:MAG: hypothetical protein JST68_05965 [Bacteroidetes bacterium]|nr:hypothetical protein [Bacteroidota bacterium]
MVLRYHPAGNRRMFFLLGLLLTARAVLGQVELRVSTGYQQERFRWSIAGNSLGRNPNVYSELKWSGVGGLASSAWLSWRVYRHWVLYAEGGRQFTSRGRVSDTDYAGDDRTGAVYHGDFSADKGYAYTLGLGGGYRFELGERRVLKPVLGYGWSGQRFSILDSRYQAKWEGVFLRCLGEWTIAKRWAVEFRAAYRQLDYHAEADWNLIHTFSHPVSFRHWANGYGVEGGLGMRYALSKRVGIELLGDYFSSQTGKGVDELYLASGSTSQTQLNEVVLVGFAVSAGLRIAW